jgi:hypothetical protein
LIIVALCLFRWPGRIGDHGIHGGLCNFGGIAALRLI